MQNNLSRAIYLAIVGLTCAIGNALALPAAKHTRTGHKVSLNRLIRRTRAEISGDHDTRRENLNLTALKWIVLHPRSRVELMNALFYEAQYFSSELPVQYFIKLRFKPGRPHVTTSNLTFYLSVGLSTGAWSKDQGRISAVVRRWIKELRPDDTYPFVDMAQVLNKTYSEDVLSDLLNARLPIVVRRRAVEILASFHTDSARQLLLREEKRARALVQLYSEYLNEVQSAARKIEANPTGKK